MPLQGFDAIQKLKDTVAELRSIVAAAKDTDAAAVADFGTKLDTAKADVAADDKQLGMIDQVSAVLNQLEPVTPTEPVP